RRADAGESSACAAKVATLDGSPPGASLGAPIGGCFASFDQLGAPTAPVPCPQPATGGAISEIAFRIRGLWRSPVDRARTAPREVGELPRQRRVSHRDRVDDMVVVRRCAVPTGEARLIVDDEA